MPSLFWFPALTVIYLLNALWCFDFRPLQLFFILSANTYPADDETENGDGSWLELRSVCSTDSAPIEPFGTAESTV